MGVIYFGSIEAVKALVPTSDPYLTVYHTSTKAIPGLMHGGLLLPLPSFPHRLLTIFLAILPLSPPLLPLLPLLPLIEVFLLLLSLRKRRPRRRRRRRRESDAFNG
jgi:hypothetical protein